MNKTDFFYDVNCIPDEKCKLTGAIRITGNTYEKNDTQININSRHSDEKAFKLLDAYMGACEKCKIRKGSVSKIQQTVR